MTLRDLSVRIRDKEISPVEVAEAVLDRIERHNEQMHAYITVTRELALHQAQEAEGEILAGHYRGPLHGTTVSLKDNVATKGIRTSCGSMVNPDWIPNNDAFVYNQLRNAGAVLVGKATLTEYALNSVNPAYPQPTNPWHSGRTPAGSSSGSAVSVATGMAHFSIGSDTGGSGRVPAHANGVVGVKATYGRVSCSGVFPLSYSLDHVTPLTRSVRDGATVLRAITGHNPRDECSLTEVVTDYCERIERDISGMRVGIARGFAFEDIDPEVTGVMDRVYDVLRSLGARLTEVDLPYLDQSSHIYSAVMASEAAAVHYRSLRESWDSYGPRARIRLALGNLIPGTAYVHAQHVRKAMRSEYKRLFQKFDAIVGPTSPTKTSLSHATTTEVNGAKIDNRELSDGYTNIYNLTGLPAIVLPAGFSSEGTPIGLQIAARWLNESAMFQVANAFEQATSWHNHFPPLPTKNAE